jgi:RNA polymerase sigma factor (sigma-70 family)
MSSADIHSTEFYLQIVANPDAGPLERDDAGKQLLGRLTSMIRGIVSGCGLGAEDAEDMIGDLCLKIVGFGLGYDPAQGGRFRDFVARCAYNWAKDLFRRRARHRGADWASGDSDVQQRLNNEPDKASEEFSSVLAEAVDNEMHEMLRQADQLAREELSDADRDIIRLVHDELLKPREAAARLGVEPSRVHFVTYHHRRRMREIFLRLGGRPLGDQ